MLGHDHILIEVKATGNKNFIDIMPKDVLADYVVWLCFEDDFSKRYPNMFVFKKPEMLGIKVGRIKCDDLMKNLADIPKCTFEFEPLAEEVV